MERRFPRDIGALDAIFAFVSEFLDDHHLDPSHSFDVDLILEELFTNMVKYNPEGERDIAIELDQEGDQLLISLTDEGVERFDVTSAPAVDVDRPIDERQPGGLGLHLVKQLADSISYEYEDRTSRIRVFKRLEA